MGAPALVFESLFGEYVFMCVRAKSSSVFFVLYLQWNAKLSKVILICLYFDNEIKKVIKSKVNYIKWFLINTKVSKIKKIVVNIINCLIAVNLTKELFMKIVQF